MNGTKSKAICILGMHRSGTSAITRALNLLGVDLGSDSKMIPPAEDNPEGFWEHSEIVEIHDQLLLLFSRYWDTTTPLPDEWWRMSEVNNYRSRLLNIVQEQFLGIELWMWKDPRTVLLLPLWQDIFQELNIQARYLIVVRNPLDVAKSLKKRNHFEDNKSFSIWLLYTLSSLYWTQNSNRTIVDYNDFLDKPELTIKSIWENFELTWCQKDEDRINSKVKPFLNPGLVHSKSEIASLDNFGVPEVIKRVYLICLKASRSKEYLTSKSFSQDVFFEYQTFLAYSRIIMTKGFGNRYLEIFWQASGIYTQQNSKRVTLNLDEQFHLYKFEINSRCLGELRIDPTNFSSIIEIKSIIVSKVNELQEQIVLNYWKNIDGWANLSFGNEIKILNAVEDLVLITKSEDPIILLKCDSAQDGTEKIFIEIEMKVKELSKNTVDFIWRNIEQLEQSAELARQTINDLRNKFDEELQRTCDINKKLEVNLEENRLQISQLIEMYEEQKGKTIDTERRLNDVFSSKSWKLTHPISAIRNRRKESNN